MKKVGGILLLTALCAYGASNPEADILVRAAESGDAKAQMKLAVAYVADPNPSNHAVDGMRVAGIPHDEQKGLYWYQKSAENGYGPAQIVLGLNYSFGHGVPVDFKRALGWFRKAQVQGTPNAMESVEALRAILESPFRTDAEKQAVRDAFEEEAKTTADLIKAANAGDVVASRRAGFRLRDGIGITRDRTASLVMLTFAAEKGDRDAQSFLGSIYSIGNGVSQDFSLAAKWLKKAADQSEPVAQFNLALAYFRGNGVPRDEVEGLKLLQQSAANGNAEAKRILAKGGSPQIEPTPTSESTIRRTFLSTAEKPTEAAVRYSIAYLDSILGKGNYTVVSSVGIVNDMDATNVSYPITTIVEVRFRGISPTSYIRRTATFACLADGKVLQPLSLPTP